MGAADELGDWRRTHYSREIVPKLDGEEVTVFGWVSSVRSQSGIMFVLLNDSAGKVQITLHRKGAPPETLRKFEAVGEHCSIAVRGVVKTMPKAPNGAEVLPEQVKVLAIPSEKAAFKVHGGNIPSLEKRLDIRAPDLRRDRAQAIFSIMRFVLKRTREFMEGKGAVEVLTPKLISSATEGGASLFSVLYYNRPAFLTQSPQLYKEQLVMPFEKVFEIGPAFRAEESRTKRHLSEITSIDLEEAFVDYTDIMSTLEELVIDLSTRLRNDCSEQFRILRVEPPKPAGRFPRITYDEVISDLAKRDQALNWGADITGKSLEALGKEHPSFYFITDWPSSTKPFYIKPKPSKPSVSESFDLMCGSLELASGGSRVGSKPLLVKRLKEQKLKPQAFEYHLRAFDYGMPPHAGFGLGVERLMMVFTSEENIREVTLYPRDKLRIVP